MPKALIKLVCRCAGWAGPFLGAFVSMEVLFALARLILIIDPMISIIVN